MSSQENNPNHPAAAAPKHHGKICEVYDCREIATHGFPGGVKEYCECHQLCDMIRL